MPANEIGREDRDMAPARPTGCGSGQAEGEDRQTVAFFDLDKTLIDAISGISFARFELREGRLGRINVAQTVLWGMLYHVQLMDIERAFARALAHYRGVPERVLLERTRRWFDADVPAMLRPGGLPALAWHRREGHRLVLLTNSSSYLADIACEAWQMDDWLSNHFEVDDRGCLTGGFERPLCYGQGKVARAERWAAEVGLNIDDAFFYSDSYSDLPMLERVAHPRLVSPDPRLRRIARKRGWPILDWGRGTGAGS